MGGGTSMLYVLQSSRLKEENVKNHIVEKKTYRRIYGEIYGMID